MDKMTPQERADAVDASTIRSWDDVDPDLREAILAEDGASTPSCGGTMAERLVRLSPQFFEHLDVLVPEERSADGTPSRTDFLLYELPRIRDQLARDFEGNTALIDDDPLASGSGPARSWPR